MRVKIAYLLLISISLPGALLAQITPPLPVHPERDGNGVDLAGWRSMLEWSPITIGTPEQGGMYLTFYFELGGGDRDNYTSDLTFVDPSAGTMQSVATIGAHTWVSAQGPNGSELGSSVALSSDNTAEYQVRDGTIAEYYSIQSYPDVAASPGTQMYFYATSVRKPNGEILTYHNKFNGWHDRIQSVASNRGYQIKFDYKSNSMADSDLSDWTTRVKATLINRAYIYCNPDADSCSIPSDWPSVSYQVTYSGNTYVHIYTNNLGEMYEINRNGLNYQVKTPGSSSYNMSYTYGMYSSPYYYGPFSVLSKIISVTKNGYTWNYSYNPETSSGQVTLSVVAPDNSTSQYYVNLGGSSDNFSWPPLIQWSKNGSGATSSYTYDSNNMILTSHMPEGNYDEVVYDQRGNATQNIAHSKLNSNSIISSALFPVSATNVPQSCADAPLLICNKPISTTDTRGNVTNYTWSADHGGVLSEMEPSPASGVARPLKLYTYVQKSAYILNAAGVLVPTGQPVWLPATETECQATVGSNTASCDAAAPQKVTTYLYGADGTADNLLIHGKQVSASGVSLLTCYGYDKWSRSISKTAPRANLGSCP